MPVAGARLGGADSDGGLLATELDPSGRPHELSVLSAVAWIHPGGRHPGADADGKFHLDAFAEEFWAALFDFGAGMVVVRADQPAHGKLGVPRAGAVRPAPVPALHDFIYGCCSGRVRNCGADAQLPLDGSIRLRAAPSFNARSVCRPLCRWIGDALGDAGLAQNLLSVRLDCAGFHFGTDQSLDRPAIFSERAA